jgi:signal transduction histidine kinase
MFGKPSLATSASPVTVAVALASALEDLEEGVALLHPEGGVAYCNAACCDLVTAPEALESFLASCSRELDLRANEASAPARTLDFCTADGRHLRLSKRATVGGGALIVIRDRTETEEQLKAARARVSEALSFKSAFLAPLGWRLRSSLNAMLGFAQLSQRDALDPLSVRHRSRVDHILHEGERLLSIFDRALELLRIDDASPDATVSVNLAEALQATVMLLEPLAVHANVRMNGCVLPADVPRVLADPSRVARILTNFVSNAIKFNRSGGSIAFRVSTSADYVRVSVADTGRGISEPAPERLFEPFFVSSAGQAQAGSGLGLAIAKSLASSMNGRVGCRNLSPTGSEFWLELPVHDPTARSGMQLSVRL